MNFPKRKFLVCPKLDLYQVSELIRRFNDGYFFIEGCEIGYRDDPYSIFELSFENDSVRKKNTSNALRYLPLFVAPPNHQVRDRGLLPIYFESDNVATENCRS